MSRLTAVAVALIALNAWAKKTIVVDGNASDWSDVTTCVNDPVGDITAGSGFDIDKACVTSDNTSANTGFMYFYVNFAATAPTTVNRWVEVFWDKDNNNVYTTADETFTLYFAANNTTGIPDALQVWDPTNLHGSPRRSYTNTADCGGNASSNGWSGRLVGNVVEMKLAYGCFPLTNGADERMFALNAEPPGYDTTTYFYYDGTADVLTTTVSPTPEVAAFAAVAQNGKNKLIWTNPTSSLAAVHEGVVVLRSTTTFTTTPVNGTLYAVGNTIGSTTVACVTSGGSTANSCVDDNNGAGLTNGTRYVYRVFNYLHPTRRVYSAGAVPSTSGISSAPTDGTGNNPRWCYATGSAAVLQPTTELATAVYSAGNAGFIAANNTAVGSASDGDERWRAVALTSPVQNRYPIVPLYGRTGNYLIVADRGVSASGIAPRVYVISATDGSVVWSTALTGETSVQSQPTVQLRNYASGTFPGTVGNRDLIFVATRNGTSNNKVYALSSVDGSVVWTYNPGNLNVVNGGMAVDYNTNRLVVASRRATGQSSLRILDSTTGTEAFTGLNLSNIDTGANIDFQSNQAYVVNTGGTAYGVSLATGAQVWSSNIGATTSWIFPVGNGFIASLTGGQVRRYTVSGSTVTQMWATASLGTPSGVVLDYANQKALVGVVNGSAMSIRQLNLATGAVEKTIAVSSWGTLGIGTPSFDKTASRVSVGLNDGRICSFAYPFQ